MFIVSFIKVESWLDAYRDYRCSEISLSLLQQSTCDLHDHSFIHAPAENTFAHFANKNRESNIAHIFTNIHYSAKLYHH